MKRRVVHVIKYRICAVRERKRSGYIDESVLDMSKEKVRRRVDVASILLPSL
jgi:hypothetical protein